MVHIYTRLWCFIVKHQNTMETEMETFAMPCIDKNESDFLFDEILTDETEVTFQGLIQGVDGVASYLP